MKTGPEMQDFATAFNVLEDQPRYSFDAHLVDSSAAGNVLFPMEQPQLTIQIVNNETSPISASGTVEVIEYGTHGVPGDVWVPVVYRLQKLPVATVPITINIPAGGSQNVVINPKVPETFAGYGVVVDLGKYGRRFVSSFIRTLATQPQRIQFPSYCSDALPIPVLQRIGVHAIRIEVQYVPTTSADYQASIAAIDEKLRQYQKADIAVLFMIEGNPLPFDQPLGMVRPWLDSNNVMLQTKCDYAWLPSYDDDFQKWVTLISEKYGWPNGPINAISLWNEPWDGISISGWGADSIRYREMFNRIVAGVQTARTESGVEILTGGTDSSTNALDKFFADGKDTYLPSFDFLSIHYMGLDSHATLKEWVDRKSPRGRVKIWDTESWVANTDDRVASIVASDRAAGYDRAMGTFGGNIASSDYYNERTADGASEVIQTTNTWSTAAAVSAATHFIGERKFNRILFQNGLPWVFLFDGLPDSLGAQNPDDGTIVVVGDLGEELGAFNLPFRTARGEVERSQLTSEWNQLTELDEGKSIPGLNRASLIKAINTPQILSKATMTITADPANFSLLDPYGNPVPSADDGSINIPLDGRGFYLRPTGVPGSFAKLTAAVQNSKITGIEPLAIQIHDPTVPFDQGSSIRLTLTNVLNQPESGNLSASLTYDHPQANGSFMISDQPPLQISLSGGQTQDLVLPIPRAAADQSNTYSIYVKFVDTQGRNADLQEYVHVDLIAHRTIKIDGSLDDWKGVLPQTAGSDGSLGPSLTESAWFPFKKFDESTPAGFSTAYLAYDDKYFYFAAKVADSTPDPGMLRFAKRNDDDYFYPNVAYQIDPLATLQKKDTVITTDSMEPRALAAPGSAGRVLAGWEAATRNFEIDLKLPVSLPRQVTLYFADPDDYGRRSQHLTIANADSGTVLAQQDVSSFKYGKFLSFNLSGSVKILVTSTNGMSSFVNALFFDPAATSGIFSSEDDTTQGNWIGKYGADGFYIVGKTPKLPNYVTVSFADFIEKTPLTWPAGVRHYTYRKDPDLPSGIKHDNIQIAFNVLPVDQKSMYPATPGTMVGYTRTIDTDYEYALNPVAQSFGGGTEIWRLAVPGMPHKTFYPREPKSPYDGPVTDGKLVINRRGNTIIYECAIPWTEIPDVKKRMEENQPIKFSYRVNDNSGNGTSELAQYRSVSKYNDSFHNDWETHWANEIVFAWQR